jgi:membrane-associated phospholipid phosphatase
MRSKSAAIVAAGVWVSLLAAALALSALASAHDTLPGDERLTTWLQDSVFPGQALSDALRAIGKTELLIAAAAVAAALLWARGYRTEALALVTGMIALALVQAVIKDVVDRPRPSPDLVDVRALYDSESFPSGHAMGTAYFYGFLVYLSLALPISRSAQAVAIALCLAVVTLTGVCSVWLGVHWPSDTIGGYLWGGVLLLPAVELCYWRRRR